MKRTLGPAVLAAGLVGGAQAQNLVQNPGFETGDFAGWTQVGGSVLRDDPHAGTFESSFSTASGALAQSLATTPNTNYTVGFYLRNAGTIAGSFQVLLGTSVLTNLTVNPSSYGLFAYNATTSALPGAATLTFQFADPGTTLHLDDVSVTANPTPEPSALAALGLGALGLLRRRRRA